MIIITYGHLNKSLLLIVDLQHLCISMLAGKHLNYLAGPDMILQWNRKSYIVAYSQCVSPDANLIKTRYDIHGIKVAILGEETNHTN